jgi:hypothetical protein
VVLRPLAAAAFITGRRPQVIYRWHQQGALKTTACDVATRVLLVDLVEVARLSATRQTRRHAA